MFFSADEKEPRQIITEDTPRKNGFARLVEVIVRDFWDFWRAGLLFLLTCLPLFLGIYFAFASGNPIVLLFAGALGGLLMGPQLSGLFDTVLCSLRDKPGFWWYIYRSHWKQNALCSLLPGMLTGLYGSAVLYMLYNFHHSSLNPGALALLLLGFVFACTLLFYLWMQLVRMELSLPQILKNSVLLLLLSPQRGLAAALLQIAYYGIFWLFQPYSSALFTISNVWFPCLCSVFLLYKPFEDYLHLEEISKNKIK